jgi:fucose permease
MDPVCPAPRPTPGPAVVYPAMGGFFLLGCLIALLGALLPVWVYHVPFDLATAGSYFLAFNLGIFAASLLARGILEKLGLRRLLAFASLLAAAAISVLAALASAIALLFPLVLLGFATGLLAGGVSWLMLDAWTAPMAGPLLGLAATFFGAGAISCVMLIWATVHNVTAPNVLRFTAALPAVLGLLFLRRKSFRGVGEPSLPPQISWRATASPAAILLALALFFQSGSEWTAGGWLAMYWIRHLGVRLEAALLALALYWAFLTLGKLLAPRWHRAFGSRRLAAFAAAATLFGCLLLFSSAVVSGAVVGVLLLGIGLGATYSLLLAMVGERFPYFRPWFFSGLLSLSLIGGMLAPWAVGHLANAWVIECAIGVPAICALMVYLLLSVVLLEARAARLSKTAPSN